MDANDINNPGEEAAGGNVEHAPEDQRQQLENLLHRLIALDGELDIDQLAELGDLDAEDDQEGQFLANAMHNMVLNAPVDLRQTIALLTNVDKISPLADQTEITPEIQEAFDNLIDALVDIEVVKDFCKLDGFDVFVLCYNTRNNELWCYTNGLLAGLCMIYPPARKLALDRGVLKKLVELLHDPDTKLKSEFVYTITHCVKGYPPSCEALLDMGGCEAMVATLAMPCDLHLGSEITSLLKYLIRRYPQETSKKIGELNFERIAIQHVSLTMEKFANIFRTAENIPEFTALTREPDLGLQESLQKMLSFQSVINDPEKSKEFVDYVNDISSIVSGQDETPAPDEEKADR